VVAPGHRNETLLLGPGAANLVKIVKEVGLKLAGNTISLDGAYNSRKNRKLIFNLGMVPNMPENKGNRKKPKRGRKQIYDPNIFAERFRTIERVFA
jgi:hypothetical protein